MHNKDTLDFLAGALAYAIGIEAPEQINAKAAELILADGHWVSDMIGGGPVCPYPSVAADLAE